MYCTQCGNRVGPDDKFCSKCGGLINRRKEKPATEKVSAQSPVVKKNVKASKLLPAKASKSALKKTPTAAPFPEKPVRTIFKKIKSKKARIITGSVAGGVAALAILIFFLLNFFNISLLQFMGIGGGKWQYSKRIIEPITAISYNEDITLGEIEKHGVSVYIPSQTFDSQTNVTLSHPEENPVIDKSAFAPLGAPVKIESAGQQRRLNRPVRVTLSIDNLRRDNSGALYVAALDEKNGWDYIVPDEVDLQNRRISFRTHHLGTYGLVNLKEEKVAEDFISRKSVRQWAEISLEVEAGLARDDLVKEILQDKLKISDESVLEIVNSEIAIDCPANKLVAAMVDRDVEMFIQSITESAARQIAEVVEPMILKKALKNASNQPWAADISSVVSEELEKENLTQATIYVLEVIASGYIADWGDLALYFFIFYNTGVWENKEIEKAYQVFKSGTPNGAPLWGYKASAGDFDQIWVQMRSAAEESMYHEISVSFNLDIAEENLSGMEIEEKNEFSENLKNRIKKQFEDRLQQEAEIIRIKENNVNMVKLLDKKGLLKTKASNPSFDKQDDFATLIDRSYGTIEKIKRDLDRYEIIFQDDGVDETKKYNPDTMIYAKDMVELVYIFHDKGEDAYRKAIADMGLIKDQTIKKLDGDEIITEDAPANDEQATKKPVNDGPETDNQATCETIKDETQTVESAVKEPGTREEINDSNLEGIWEDEFGSKVKLSNGKSVYIEFSEEMQKFADAGVLSLGDIQMKDIAEKIDADSDYEKWTCYSLVLFSLDPYEPDAIGWSDYSFIVLSQKGDFFILSVTATHPETGEVYIGKTFIYNRVIPDSPEDGQGSSGPTPES